MVPRAWGMRRPGASGALAMTAAADPDSAFSDAEIEAGRRLFAGAWQFLAAAGALAALPPMAATEIAFAGRSNVGKSSLINALTGRRALARTSGTPGRTQELIFFGHGQGGVMLVDMPGYGYAAAPKAKVNAWTRLIQEYLRGRATLARVYLLVDARRGMMPADEEIMTLLDKVAVSYQVVLTKCDALAAAALAGCLAELRNKLARRPAAYPVVLATSAETGAGIAELRAAIHRLLSERR
jgi:GTP-binding protein